MTQVPTSPQPQTDPRNTAHDAATEGDELAHLFKMSKTAGVGTSEYVAINGWAIFALVMGLASLLALVWPVMLVFPIVGTLAAFIAWRQIGRSAGTQGGIKLTAIGLLLSLGIGSYVATREATEERRTRADRQLIADLIDQLEAALRGNRFDQAYLLFTDTFREATSEAEFFGRMRMFSKTGFFGEMQTMTPGEKTLVERDPVTGREIGQTRLIVVLSKSEQPQRVNAKFQLVDGVWMLSDLPDIFPPNVPQGLPSTGMPEGVPGLPPM